jgi:hypothetical protein
MARRTFFLLTISPNSCESLLVRRWVPICVNLSAGLIRVHLSTLVPGSNRIRRFAPMRLIPHPPALLLSRKINSFPLGSLNWSTSFWRFVMLMVPSSRKHPYLWADVTAVVFNKKQTYFFARQSFSNRSRVWV